MCLCELIEEWLSSFPLRVVFKHLVGLLSHLQQFSVSYSHHRELVVEPRHERAVRRRRHRDQQVPHRGDEALRLAAEIRQRGLGTAIPADYACYSACTYLYFAGRDHFTRGKLGVHRVSSEGYSDAAAAGVYDGDVRAAMRQYGASVEVIHAMVSTPPSKLHVFSRKEIAAYSINHGAGTCLAAKYAGL